MSEVRDLAYALVVLVGLFLFGLLIVEFFVVGLRRLFGIDL
jgi:hypothetical protein